MSGTSRIPPIQCLLTFEALARLRSGHARPLKSCA
jgi:hypothetical protein